MFSVIKKSMISPYLQILNRLPDDFGDNTF